MMRSPEVRLLAVGTALPGPPVDNGMLARKYGMGSAWRQWVDAFIGTEIRHYGFDLQTGERQATMTDLGSQAASAALRSAGLRPEAVDLLVMGTATPDELMPATVNRIADRIGVDDVASFQLQSGCSGAVQALEVARQLLIAGQYRTALVLGAESVFKQYEANLQMQEADPAHLVNTLIFGDGAGAAVLTTDRQPDAPVLRTAMVRMVGGGQEPGQVMEWFGAGDVERAGGAAPAIIEDYKAIEKQVPILAKEVLTEMLDELDWTADDMDYLLPPQLSGRMTAEIVDFLDLDRTQVISCVREIGNIGNANPFFQLERVLPLLGRGDRALCVSIESSKWIKSGFALEGE